MSSYYLGLDGGGTKTAAVVVDGSMTVLGRGDSGPSNSQRVGIDEASRNLDAAIHEAAARAGIAGDDITYAVCGIAGYDHPYHGPRLLDALRALFPRGNLTASTDARIALTAGIGFGAGIVIVSGTGSVALGRNPAGDEARAGGWGPVIGDEGSGYSIGRHGLIAVMRAHDGRGPATRLTHLVCAHLHLRDAKELAHVVYAPTTHADTIATYSRLVAEAAREGDAVARSILDGAGRELAATVLAVARRLGMLESELPVATVGGVFRIGELILDPLRRTLAASAPGAALQPAIEAPVEGAARMAIRAARG